MPAALEVRDLIKDYPGVRAVDGVSFAVPDGICFGLLGPNGAGKTTTIEIIEGVTKPTSGAVWYQGEPAGRQFREEVGIQFQNTALQDHLKVGETLEMFQKLYDRRGNLDRIIDECALGDLLDRDNRKLSGGQRQRLLLAVALVNEPRIVFLDEPTTGLDPQARRNFWELVKSIRDKGTTIILTTHYMDEAQILCDEIAIMDAGRIIARGNPDALLRERYRNVIIELPIEDVGRSLEGLDHRKLDTRGVVEIETDDVNSSLADLSRRQTPLQHLRIRQPNLEDLFIDLTGHSLRA
jgi:ABC-2 type transport system ATP-binding protein